MTAMTATERKRLERERKGNGEMVLPRISIPFDTIDTMVEAGRLAQWDADDPVKVAEALSAHLKDLRAVDVERVTP